MVGSEWDLGVDGAYDGLRVVILQAYVIARCVRHRQRRLRGPSSFTSSFLPFFLLHHQHNCARSYWEEAFDGSKPVRALREKGFEVVHHTSQSPLPSLEEFEGELEEASQVWVIASSKQWVPDR